MTKPLFIWAGGKNKMMKHYRPYMPSSVDSYCEPFFGGGAMFVHVMSTYKPKQAFINDRNPDIMRIYRMIKEHHDAFVTHVTEYESKYLPLSKEDRKKYYFDLRHQHGWDYQQWDEVKEAATLYFLMKTGFNGIYQLNKNTNGRYGTPSGLLNQTDKVFDRDVVRWWNQALQVTEMTSTDWSNAVTDVPTNAFFFFDPPYRDSFADYGNAFDDDALHKLIEFCNDKPNVFLANRADDEWFETRLQDMSHEYFPVTYTAGRRKKTDDGFEAKSAREILLYNIEQTNTLEAVIDG
jgi:DNA adenine methylase